MSFPKNVRFSILLGAMQQSVSSGRFSKYPEHALSETARKKIRAGLPSPAFLRWGLEFSCWRGKKKADDFVHAYLTRIYSGVMIRFEQKYHIYEYSIVIYVDDQFLNL